MIFFLSESEYFRFIRRSSPSGDFCKPSSTPFQRCQWPSRSPGRRSHDIKSRYCAKPLKNIVRCMKYKLVTIKLFWNFLAPPVKPTPAPNLLDDLMGGDTTHNNQMNGNDGMLTVCPPYVKLERDASSVWSKSLKCRSWCDWWFCLPYLFVLIMQVLTSWQHLTRMVWRWN